MAIAPLMGCVELLVSMVLYENTDELGSSWELGPSIAALYMHVVSHSVHGDIH